jgi:hypothetical protein
MITYCFIINYHLLFIIKIAEAVSINKTNENIHGWWGKRG